MIKNKFSEIISPKEFQKFKSFYCLTDKVFHDNSITFDRVIDCCCGNSFLGWYSLLQKDNLQVLAIDKVITNRSKKIRRYFMNNYSELLPCYTFRKQDITKEEILLPKKSLLVSIHACGNLTDYIIKHAINNKVPFAVMPCCYNSSRIYWKDSNVKFNSGINDYIDELRLNYIRKHYKFAEMLHIGKEITPMNKILVGGKFKDE